MAETATLRGSLVGWEKRPYAGFTDRQTGELRPPGETLWLHVSHQAEDQQPVREIKVRGNRREDWAGAVDLGWGAQVEVAYELVARKGQIVAELLSIRPLVEAA